MAIVSWRWVSLRWVWTLAFYLFVHGQAIGMWWWFTWYRLGQCCTWRKESPDQIMGLSTRDLGSRSDADRGSGTKCHYASTRPLSRSALRAVLRDSAWDPVQLCNVMWSSRKTTLNPDQGSGSSESGFSARVESPYVVEKTTWIIHSYKWLWQAGDECGSMYTHANFITYCTWSGR